MLWNKFEDARDRLPEYVNNEQSKNQFHLDVRFLDEVGGVTYKRLVEVQSPKHPDDFVGQEGRVSVAVHTLFMINNRMIVAGPLYSDEEGEDKWAELGAGAMTGPLDLGVGPAEIDSARRIGERVARLAKKLSD